MMSFKFQPQTEEEVLNLLPAGVYKFQVKNAENKVSKSGNAMIKLTLAIWDSKGSERHITDYLLAAMMYKVKHFCDTTGLDDKYKAGEFSATDCIGKSGQCKLRIEESDGYAPKNSVQDYVKEKVGAVNDVPTNILADKNDDFDELADLPF